LQLLECENEKIKNKIVEEILLLKSKKETRKILKFIDWWDNKSSVFAILENIFTNNLASEIEEKKHISTKFTIDVLSNYLLIIIYYL
jgi:hypothetical protein